MTVLVTGAAGFIGSHLCARLIADGEDVRAVDRFSPSYARESKERNIAGLPLELVEGDLAEIDIDRLLVDVEAVFHLAAQPGVRGAWDTAFDVYVRDNIVATQRLLEAMRARQARLIHVSTSSIYGERPRPARETDSPSPMSPYGITKLAAEQLVQFYARAHKLDAVILRLFSVYGPHQRPDMAVARFIDAALTGKSVAIFGDGAQVRALTYVDDVVEALVRARSAAAGTVANIAGDSRVSVKVLLDTIEQLSGRRISVDVEERRAEDPHHLVGDTTRAREELGWVPATALHDGLRAQIAYARIAG